MKLYSYYRSSAAYRVRIALALKEIPYETVVVNLRDKSHLQRHPDYLTLNPLGVVPTLVHGSNTIPQSAAILEYLEEAYPSPALLPADAIARARVRAMGQMIACDIHPLNNLRVLRYLKHQLGVNDDARTQWYRHWVESGLAAVEALLEQAGTNGNFCFGDGPTLADVMLIPQVANARLFDCDLTAVPNIVRIDEHCRALPAFQVAAPENQPDFPDR